MKNRSSSIKASPCFMAHDRGVPAPPKWASARNRIYVKRSFRSLTVTAHIALICLIGDSEPRGTAG
jgi:hypothetical protein